MFKQFGENLVSTKNVPLIIISYLAIVLISSNLNVRLDLTSGGLYILSEGSKKIVKAIDDDITIKYFFSQSNRTLPIQVKNYGKRVGELLAEFADESSSVKLEVYDPKPDSDEEELAARYGINGAVVGDGEAFYMGAALLYLDEVYQIPFFDPQREKFLEYEIASLLSKVGEKKKKTIGILSGFEMGAPSLPFMAQGKGGQQQDDWLFKGELENLYEVRSLDKDLKEVPSDIDLLLVAHPTGIDEKTEYAIEQYILGGGKSVLLVDPSLYSLQTSSGSDLPKVFQTLGLNYNSSEVVVDEQNAAVVNTRQGRVRLPVWLSFADTGFSKSVVATSDLQSGLFAEAGHFELKPESKFEFEPLIQTSEQSGTVSSYMARSLAQRPSAYSKKEKALNVAGVVKGKFTSSFDGKPKESSFKGEHIKEAKEEVSVMVVADVDFLNNEFALKAFNFFGRTVVQPQNHNLAFLMNSLEFVSGRPELISVRSRGSFSRPFLTVQKLERKAQERWFGVEEELSRKISDLQTKLNQLQNAKTNDNQVLLTQAQKEEVKKFKLEQIAAKKKRREVRKQLRHEIESLGSILSGLNMAVMPLVVFSFGMFIYRRRNQGMPVFGKEDDR
jgi:ABC-type uncharacterized transport system involved in gliding motility auxiliary subunit